jgi:hypothetical protein
MVRDGDVFKSEKRPATASFPSEPYDDIGQPPKRARFGQESALAGGAAAA